MNLQKYTDDVIAIVVVGGTFIGYYVGGLEIPTEPMMLVLGYFFGKKVSGVV